MTDNLNPRHLRILRETYAQGRCWMHTSFGAEVGDLFKAELVDVQLDAPGVPRDYFTVLPVRTHPGWGSPWGEGVAYYTPSGPVFMWRRHQAVRFYLPNGEQVGPQQANVAPALAYAASQEWERPRPLVEVWIF